jgi:hypothetical protein
MHTCVQEQFKEWGLQLGNGKLSSETEPNRTDLTEEPVKTENIISTTGDQILTEKGEKLKKLPRYPNTPPHLHPPPKKLMATEPNLEILELIPEIVQKIHHRVNSMIFYDATIQVVSSQTSSTCDVSSKSPNLLKLKAVVSITLLNNPYLRNKLLNGKGWQFEDLTQIISIEN